MMIDHVNDQLNDSVSAFNSDVNMLAAQTQSDLHTTQHNLTHQTTSVESQLNDSIQVVVHDFSALAIRVDDNLLYAMTELQIIQTDFNGQVISLQNQLNAST